jgi:hypothetical protein
MIQLSYYLNCKFHTIGDDEITKKRKVDVVKIKFHLNENVAWHYMQFELNWNSSSTSIRWSLDPIELNAFE